MHFSDFPSMTNWSLIISLASWRGFVLAVVDAAEITLKYYSECNPNWCFRWCGHHFHWLGSTRPAWLHCIMHKIEAAAALQWDKDFPLSQWVYLEPPPKVAWLRTDQKQYKKMGHGNIRSNTSTWSMERLAKLTVLVSKPHRVLQMYVMAHLWHPWASESDLCPPKRMVRIVH